MLRNATGLAGRRNLLYDSEVQRDPPMKQQPRIPRRQVLHLQNLYAQYFADSFEFCEEHLTMLRARRDSYLKSLRA